MLCLETIIQWLPRLLKIKLWDLLKLGNLAYTDGLVNKLPLEIIDSRPRLGIVFCLDVFADWKIGKIENYLTTAEKNLESLDNSDELRRSDRCYPRLCYRSDGIWMQAIRSSYNSLSNCFPKDDFTVRCVVAFVLGGIYYIQQDMPKALATLKEASQLGEQAGNLHVAVGALSALGGALEQQGNLVESEKVFYRALQIGTGRSGQPLPIAANVYSGLAKLRLVAEGFCQCPNICPDRFGIGRKIGQCGQPDSLLSNSGPN